MLFFFDVLRHILLPLSHLLTNPCFLTELELHRLHCRFGYPSVRQFYQVLERSGHDVELPALEHLTKYSKPSL